MSDVELRKPEVLVVREHEREIEIASGAMTRIAGVSEALTGAKGIHLAEALIPPGRCSTAHYHSNCESAIYVAAGEGLMLSGHMIYIPPGAAHQPVNTSDSEPLRLIVARNTPVELVVEMDGKGRTDC